MNKKVTLRELVGARIVVAICIAVFYWCWARNNWENYFISIQNFVAIFLFCFSGFCFCARKSTKKR